MLNRAGMILRRSMTAAELVLWSLLLIGLILVKLQPNWQPLIYNDSFQYLSTAENLRAGLPGYTSLVFFDEERSHGVIPAPLTTFPSGYSLLIAGVELLGAPGEVAGLVVSALAAVGCLWMLALLAARLEFGASATRGLLLMFGSSYAALLYSCSVLTEMTFTLTVLAAVTCAVIAIQGAQRGGRWIGAAIGAGVLFGAAYWIRYAGLFFLMALAVYGLAGIGLRRRAMILPTLVAGIVAALFLSVGMARNIVLTGGWRGGNNKFVSHEWLQIARDFVFSMADIALGPLMLSQWNVGHWALCGLFVVVVVMTLWWVLSCAAVRESLKQRLGAEVGLVALLAAVYTALLIYAASRTMISFGMRFFLPALPLVMVVITAIAVSVVRGLPQSKSRSVWVTTWILVVLLSAGLHISLFLQTPASRTKARVDERLSQSLDSSGRTGYEVIRSMISPDEVIVANLGQATGYLLRRSTVALIEPEFSEALWDEPAVKDVFQRYSAKLLIVHKLTSDEAFHDYPSTFVQQLAEGQAPGWLRLEVESPWMAIYRPALQAPAE